MEESNMSDEEILWRGSGDLEGATLSARARRLAVTLDTLGMDDPKFVAGLREFSSLNPLERVWVWTHVSRHPIDDLKGELGQRITVIHRSRARFVIDAYGMFLGSDGIGMVPDPLRHGSDPNSRALCILMKADDHPPRLPSPQDLSPLNESESENA